MNDDDVVAVATALTACGIETNEVAAVALEQLKVATALTACGIETDTEHLYRRTTDALQQHLPLAVLKLELS